MSQIGVADSVDMTPEEIIDWREKFVHSGAKKPLPTSPSTLTSRPQVSHILPRPPPLRAAEYKVILRVRGGVNCASIHPVSLRDIVIKSTGLSAAAASLDRLRANEINNTIIISTPCMDRADRYLKIATLTIMGKSYEVSTHVADPENSCKGIIKLPASLVERNVLANLRESNPAINILTARRMGTTDFILVTFEGLRVPFYIDYLRTDLRCRPYRQKVEACTKCRQLGHRQDVCPNATTALCPKCGTPDPPEDHSCTPTCIICNGAHETGSSECRLRYKPPRTPPPTPPETKPELPAKSTTQATGQRPGQEKPQSSPGHKNPATAAQPPSSKQAGPPLTPRNQERPPVDPTTDLADIRKSHQKIRKDDSKGRNAGRALATERQPVEQLNSTVPPLAHRRPSAIHGSAPQDLATRALTITTDTAALTTSSGIVYGRRVTTASGVRINQFLGVPYALDTSGSRRFMDPVPLARFPRETWKAQEPGPACTQWLSGSAHGSEDCLHLSIWAPAKDDDKHKKSLVLALTGDWFQTGNTASDGAVKWAELAADINGVVVAPNHRLGVFGFLDVGVRGMLGNVALQDVLLAMSWVDKNAGALNVDTDNMAAFGLGSGAYVLSLLLMSSSSANDTLFRRAFLQVNAVM
ncbi:hypothetical protein HPB52_007074 [Rhipicephalus sanguineus]|uniref:Carboxylesterase type B domain-containing protein n=1 Tax=Rhipicephalus sanguineus TaxID=34632 RepID=A0A9D4PZQ5_RHISA|nr:hypothetical protein HPB52_007074 [Rhipicephalus sanguineus]